MGPKKVTVITKSWRGWHLVDIVPLVTHNVFASLHLIAHIQCASLHNTVFRNNGWRWNDSHWKTFKLWHNVFLIRFLSDPSPVIAFPCQSGRHPTSGLLEFCLNCWICPNFYIDFSNCWMDFSKLIHWIFWVVTGFCQICYMDLFKLLHRFVMLFYVFLALCWTKPS